MWPLSRVQQVRNKKPHGNTAALRRTGRRPAAEHVNTALSPLYIHAGADSKEGGEGNLCSAWLYWFLYVTDYMGKRWTGGRGGQDPAWTASDKDSHNHTLSHGAHSKHDLLE